MKGKILVASNLLAAVACIAAMVVIMKQIDKTRARLTSESPGAMNYLMQATHNLNKFSDTVHRYRFARLAGQPTENLGQAYRDGFDVVWSSFRVFELRFPGDPEQQTQVAAKTEEIWQFLRASEPLMAKDYQLTYEQALTLIDNARAHIRQLHIIGTRFFIYSSVAQDATSAHLAELNRAFWIFAAALLLAGGLLIWLVRRVTLQAASSHDITRKTQREMATVVEQLNSGNIEKRQIESFIAEASHDLRQPLQALVFQIESLKNQVQSEAGKQSLLAAKQSASHLSNAFNSVLDMSQLDAGKITTRNSVFELGHFLRMLQLDYSPIAEAANIELILNACAFDVDTDPVLLDRILRNLLENAVRHSGANQITLTANRTGDNHASIVLHDNGSGIPAAEHDSIFSEYYQISNQDRDRSKGFGLGLAIVKRLAALAGIDIQLQSSATRGTQFTLTLPATAGSSRQASDRTTPSIDLDYHGKGKLVAVLDDQPLVRASVEALLMAWKFETVGAAKSEELLAEISRRDLQPDLIIADYQLQRSTGDAAIEEICAHLERKVPALIITGNTSSETLALATSSGHPVLQKPIEPEALIVAVRKILEADSSATELEKAV